jgi:hypothetical protein
MVDESEVKGLHHYSPTVLNAFAGLAMGLYTDASRCLLAQTVEMRSEAL